MHIYSSLFSQIVPRPGVADTLRGVANTATFTAFTSFLANFENFSKCFQLFQGQKTFSIKSAQKMVDYPKKIENIFHFTF